MTMTTSKHSKASRSSPAQQKGYKYLLQLLAMAMATFKTPDGPQVVTCRIHS